MRELLLLRHGKSDWPPNMPDFERTLTRRGKESAALVGGWLRDEEHVPDYIVTSPARRAIDTAKRVAKTLGISNDEIIEEPRLYHADPQTILAVARDQPDMGQRVLLVGHNPGMESFYGAVSGVLEPFETAALGILQFEGEWADFTPDNASAMPLIRPRGQN